MISFLKLDRQTQPMTRRLLSEGKAGLATRLQATRIWLSWGLGWSECPDRHPPGTGAGPTPPSSSRSHLDSRPAPEAHSRWLVLGPGSFQLQLSFRQSETGNFHAQSLHTPCLQSLNSPPARNPPQVEAALERGQGSWRPVAGSPAQLGSHRVLAPHACPQADPWVPATSAESCPGQPASGMLHSSHAL